MAVLWGLVALLNLVSLVLQLVTGWFLSKIKVYTNLSRVKLLFLAASFALQCVCLKMLLEILSINVSCAVVTFLWLALSIVEYIIIRKSYETEYIEKAKKQDIDIRVD